MACAYSCPVQVNCTVNVATIVATLQLRRSRVPVVRPASPTVSLRFARFIHLSNCDTKCSGDSFLAKYLQCYKEKGGEAGSTAEAARRSRTHPATVDGCAGVKFPCPLPAVLPASLALYL